MQTKFDIHSKSIIGLREFNARPRLYQFLVAYTPLSYTTMASAPLRIGFVPEHFSTPLYFAQQHFGLDATLVPFPSGTGHMVTAIRAGEIDVGIGLTEGWIAGLGKDGIEGDGGYRLVGTYVDTPLCKTSIIWGLAGLSRACD
jgi:hypothetical protein